VKEDLIAHVDPSQRNKSAWKWAFAATGIVVRSSGFHVAFLYRVGHFLRTRCGAFGVVTSGLIFWFVRHAYCVSIASTAHIEGGLILPHPQGIVIGAGAVIGPRAWIFQNVTIGGSPSRAGLPVIGSDSRIYSGAVVSGPISVGDRVLIGANAVITFDVPSDTIASANRTTFEGADNRRRLRRTV
jgi:serine O-acetyltransferase